MFQRKHIVLTRRGTPCSPKIPPGSSSHLDTCSSRTCRPGNSSPVCTFKKKKTQFIARNVRKQTFKKNALPGSCSSWFCPCWDCTGRQGSCSSWTWPCRDCTGRWGSCSSRFCPCRDCTGRWGSCCSCQKKWQCRRRCSGRPRSSTRCRYPWHRQSGSRSRSQSRSKWRCSPCRNCSCTRT
jgi:hypothetical protein